MDNLFVLGAVIKVTDGKEAPIPVQIQDVEKCFDKMWIQATTNSLHDAGIQSDMLNILHNENVKVKVAIKRPQFKKKRSKLPAIVENI